MFLQTQPFASDIQIKEIADPGATGNFEVRIVETGQLIHSNTQRGMGKCNTDSARHAVAIYIEDALEEL